MLSYFYRLNTLHFNRYIYAVIFLIPLLYFSYLNRFYQFDDVMIYQRYIENLFAGQGLVYNIGERFNGLTSSFYTYLIAGFAFLSGDIQLTMMAVSTLGLAAAVYLMGLILIRYEIRLLVLLYSAVLTVCFPYLYFTYGMETTLFLFLITLCLYLFEIQATFYLGIACALLLLTRSEGIFLILALLVEHIRQKRAFPQWYNFIIPTLIISIILGFNKFYYGHFFAETGMAKIYQGQAHLWGNLLDNEEHVRRYFAFNSFNFWALHLFAFFGVLRLRMQSINVIIVLFLAFYFSFYIYLNIPNYHWYYAPYYFFMFFYSGLGLAWWIDNCRFSQERLFKYVGVAVLLYSAVYILYISANTSYKNLNTSRHGLASQHTDYIKIGQWIKENTAEESRIGMAEIGFVGKHSQRYIVDLFGLVNPHNAKFIAERDLSTWLSLYQPDYVLVHHPMWRFERGLIEPVLTGHYQAVEQFKFKHFSLLEKTDTSALKISTFNTKRKALDKIAQQAVVKTTVPSTIQFDLPVGTYQLQANFGLPHITDRRSKLTFPLQAVEFKVVLNTAGIKKVIFQQTIDGRYALPTVLHAIEVSPFTVDKVSTLNFIMNTTEQEPIPHSQAWGFWHTIQVTPIQQP